MLRGIWRTRSSRLFFPFAGGIETRTHDAFEVYGQLGDQLAITSLILENRLYLQKFPRSAGFESSQKSLDRGALSTMARLAFQSPR